MSSNHIFSIFSIALAALSLVSCKEKGFSVEGSVKGASGRMITLERQDPVAGWIGVDSMTIAGDGTFDFSAPAPECPEMFRLRLDGRYVYLPVDSIESLSLRADAASFDTSFSLAGSRQAEQLTEFEHEALRVEGYNNPDSVKAFKRRVYDKYLRDSRGSILSYHILTRPMGDGWLIDYTDPLYAAVATSFEAYRPSDPHTAMLAARAREGQAQRRKMSGKGVKLQASSTGMIEIALPGLDAKERRLSSMLGKGKPVIVAFVAMTREDTPAVNRELRRLYDAGRADVYEVCLDADQFAWREASRALPWTVVIDPDGAESRVALQYNVGSLPVFFIYDSRGDLVQSTGRVTEISSFL